MSSTAAEAPLHFEDEQQSGGSSTVDVAQPPPAPDRVTILSTLNMDYIISYKNGPPPFPWSFGQAGMNPNYPYPQQPYYGVPGLWCPPYVPAAINYFTPPAVEMPYYCMWQPPPPYVQVTFRQQQCRPRTIQGSSIPIENPVPNPCLPRNKSVLVQEEKRELSRLLPPDIHDETVFPALTKKVEYLEPAMNLPFHFSSNSRQSPRSPWEMKKVENYENVMPNNIKITNHNGLDGQQNKNNMGKKDFLNKLLKIEIEDTYQPKEKAGTDFSADIIDKNIEMLPKKVHHKMAADHKIESHWLISRSSWPLADVVHYQPQDLSLRSMQLYRYLLWYVPSKNRLEELGHPIVSFTNPKEAMILKKEFHYSNSKKNNTKNATKYFDKICERCGKSFVTRSGKIFYREKCVYHWGKPLITEDFNAHLTCCKRLPQSYGCSSARSHVWNGLHYGMNAGLKGFVCTRSTRSLDTNIYGLDCEMCFTTEGLELVKVALVNLAGNQVYYSLVIPENEVVDYNTRFSGVSERDFWHFKARSFRKVQADILKLITSNTIIIGHGLENDLRALKIIHHLVVDTSIVYPHKHGFPLRRPLRAIAEEVLKRKIQQGGHNPVEDANVCVELILKQLKKDFNIRITPDQ